MQSPTHDTDRLLLVDSDPQRLQQLASRARERGYVVDTATDVAGALRTPLPTRAVLHTDLADGDGLALLGELQVRGRDLPVVMLADDPDHAVTRGAWSAGAIDLLPSDTAPDSILARLSEARAATAATPAARDEQRFDISDEQRLLRELAAECLRQGLGPGARVRALSAAAEAVANIRTHAYQGSTGPVFIGIERNGRGLRIAIRDEGAGCDATAARLDSTAAALPGSARPGGLARIGALVEGLEFTSEGGTGTRVELFVADHPTDFEGWSDLDWLSPKQARELLDRFEDPIARPELPPALACALGRLLSCDSPDRRARRALWN
ncbi:MAG: ATP-binding protein [Planctomycetota bacterium]|jgi:ActR/RegA family two-component response regulator